MKNNYLLAVAAVIAFAPMAANAIPMTFRYESLDFTQLTGVPTGVTALSGMIRLDVDPFPNTGAGSFGVNHTVLDFSFTDGLSTMNWGDFIPNSPVPLQRLVTDTTGAVTNYAFAFDLNPLLPVAVGTATRFFFRENFGTFGQTTNAAGVQYCTAIDSATGACTTTATARVPTALPAGSPVSNAPAGKLTLVTVPEPGTLSLLIAGLLGLGFMCRRRAA